MCFGERSLVRGDQGSSSLSPVRDTDSCFSTFASTCRCKHREPSKGIPNPSWSLSYIATLLYFRHRGSSPHMAENSELPRSKEMQRKALAFESLVPSSEGHSGGQRSHISLRALRGCLTRIPGGLRDNHENINTEPISFPPSPP